MFVQTGDKLGGFNSLVKMLEELTAPPRVSAVELCDCSFFLVPLEFKL